MNESLSKIRAQKSTVDEKAARAREAGAERGRRIRSPLYWIGVEKKYGGHGGPYVTLDHTQSNQGGNQ